MSTNSKPAPTPNVINGRLNVIYERPRQDLALLKHKKPDENGSSNQSNRQSPDHLTSPSAVPFALGQQSSYGQRVGACERGKFLKLFRRESGGHIETANRHMMAVPITANAQRRSVAEEAKSTRIGHMR